MKFNIKIITISTTAKEIAHYLLWLFYMGIWVEFFALFNQARIVSYLVNSDIDIPVRFYTLYQYAPEMIPVPHGFNSRDLIYVDAVNLAINFWQNANHYIIFTTLLTVIALVLIGLTFRIMDKKYLVEDKA